MSSVSWLILSDSGCIIYSTRGAIYNKANKTNTTVHAKVSRVPFPPGSHHRRAKRKETLKHQTQEGLPLEYVHKMIKYCALWCVPCGTCSRVDYWLVSPLASARSGNTSCTACIALALVYLSRQPTRPRACLTSSCIQQGVLNNFYFCAPIEQPPASKFFHSSTFHGAYWKQDKINDSA